MLFYIKTGIQIRPTICLSFQDMSWGKVSTPQAVFLCYCIQGSPSLEQGKWQLFSCFGQFHTLYLGTRQSLFLGEVHITSLPAASSLHLPVVECICYQTWSFTNQADKSQRMQPSFCKPISCTTVEPRRQKSICWTDTLVMLLTPESQDFILIPDSYPTGEVKLTPASKFLTQALWLALILPNVFS